MRKKWGQWLGVECFYRPQNGSSGSLLSVGTQLPNCTVSHPRRS